MMVSPRKYLGIAVLLAVAVLVAGLGVVVAGCGGSSGGGSSASPSSSAMPVADVLRASDDGLVSTWDPRVTGSGEVQFMVNMYEPLVWAKPEGGEGDARYAPGLAESWEVSSDGLEYTFNLRQGVTFHDGTPFNADAVKYSIDAIIELGQGYAYLWGDLDRVEVIDDYTVKFYLKDSIPLLDIASSEYGAWIFSPATKGKSTKWWDEGKDAGTGPYMLESYKPQQEIVMSAYPDYWGGWKDNQYKTIVSQVITEANTGQQMLEAGQLDWLGVIPFDQIDALKANPDVQVQTWRSLVTMIAYLNCAKKPLSDPLVRQALSYATPTEDMIAACINGFGTPSAGLIPVGLWPHNDAIQPYPYDLEKAKELLAQAGYPDGFDMELDYITEEPYMKTGTTLMKESYAEIGVNVTVKGELFTTVLERARGNPQDAMDAWTVTWYPAFANGYDSMRTALATESKGVWNLSYWYSPEFDQLIKTGWTTESTDPTGAKAAYDQAQQMIYDDAPMLTIWDDQRVTVASSKLNVDPWVTNPFYPNATLFYYLTLK
jgi:peptide/nickel transport system substrate-binding protein